MKKNDLIELEITDIGDDGAGIGRCEGMAFFVRDAVPGDVIRARITKLKKSFGYARLEEILTPSAHRTEPACGIYRRCGGCQLQALEYEKQLEFKQEKVRSSLIRIGGFPAADVERVMEPIVGMESPYRYRNKAQFPVGTDRDGALVAGFYAARTHSIVPVEDCKLGAPVNREILRAVLVFMRENQIAPYDEETGEGLVRHVLIRCGFATGEIMVCVVINGVRLPKAERLVDALRGIRGMTSISVNLNRERTNVILGGVTETVWGQPYITDSICLRRCGNWGLDGENEAACAGPAQTRAAEGEFDRTNVAVAYHISPQSFYQVNPGQTEKLYSLALEYAGLTGKETVWDLYCGIGTISLFLAQKAKQVYGVEVVPQAVEDAKNNAKLNGIENAAFFVGKAEEVLEEFYGRGEMARPDVIIVDPPRKGCDEACLAAMLRVRPERIVYVSCDPATLARDLRVLCDGGYEIKRVRAVDQFGQTVHTETCVLLSQRHIDDYIRVSIDLEPDDVTPAETKATYDMIKKYVLEQFRTKVSSLYVAQIKRKYGLELGENYNKPKSWDAKVPICPAEKEKMIVAALRHFQMIS